MHSREQNNYQLRVKNRSAMEENGFDNLVTERFWQNFFYENRLFVYCLCVRKNSKTTIGVNPSHDIALAFHQKSQRKMLEWLEAQVFSVATRLNKFSRK